MNYKLEWRNYMAVEMENTYTWYIVIVLLTIGVFSRMTLFF
jgi:hypothetical protein